MGGFIAQVIAAEEPDLVRKLILAGTGPAGGPGIDKVTSLTIKDTVKAVLTRKDPKQYLFFTDTAGGRRAAHAFLDRLKERTNDRDKAISLSSFRAQLKAIHRWGRQAPADLSRHQPVLAANGESDRMVPSINTVDLAARLPQGELEPLYPDADTEGSSSTTTDSSRGRSNSWNGSQPPNRSMAPAPHSARPAPGNPSSHIAATPRAPPTAAPPADHGRTTRHHRPSVNPPPGRALALDRSHHHSPRPAHPRARPMLTSQFLVPWTAPHHRTRGTRRRPEATLGSSACTRSTHDTKTVHRLRRRTVMKLRGLTRCSTGCARQVG